MSHHRRKEVKAVRWRVSAVAVAVATTATLLGVATSQAEHRPSNTAGHSTLEQTIVGGDPSEGFSLLELGPGEPYLVREPLADAQPGRRERRKSLVYFGQITDFQLADEESPAREERTDSEPFRNEDALGSSGFRPQEALGAQTVELTIRQMNEFLFSPVRQGDGTRARMVNAVMTGDLADNMQRNETEWVLRLLEGGTLDPNSGTSDFSGTFCEGMPANALDDPENYTGVQDYDDYSPDNPIFYDPEHPIGTYAQWPVYPGLLDRAQEPFTAEGLIVPSYVAFGNHDGLYQGTVSAAPAILREKVTWEQTAVDCLKPVFPVTDQDAIGVVLSPDYLAQVFTSDPGKVMLVPPDKNRQFVDHEQFKDIFDPAANPQATQADAHGFAYVDRHQLEASDGYAAYYSFSPKPGIRFIVLDTLAQAGVLASPNREGDITGADDGNIDAPQFRWLRRELNVAEARDELVIAFGHHTSETLDVAVPDEANPCTTIRDQHGHDVNPSCDTDPRRSTPIHDGGDLFDLFLAHPNVIAYVGGHEHENLVTPHSRRGGGALWEITSPATADWPPQHRVIEVMDNRDGTLSIFGTVLDHVAPTATPDSGTSANTDGSEFNLHTLGAISRVLTYNDPHEGPGESEGHLWDRNVELLLRDPREGTGPDCDGVAATIVGTGGEDEIRGTPQRDVVVAGGGEDDIRTGSGNDVICAGMGDDEVRTGSGGDRALGNRGGDRVRGRSGPDRLFGNRGQDELRGAGGDDFLSGHRDRDRLRGGGGDDTLQGGQGRDELRGGPGDDSETQ